MSYMIFKRTSQPATDINLNQVRQNMLKINILHNEDNTGNGYTIKLVEKFYEENIKNKPKDIKILIINDYGFVATNVLYNYGYKNIYVIFKAYTFRNNKLIISSIINERSMIETAKRIASKVFDNYIKIISVKEEAEMEFDLKLMNPPYDSNLHLKCLRHELNTAGDNCTVINLSPIRWLQDPLAEKKQGSDFNEFTDIYENITSLTKITATEAQKNFDIGVAMDLGIYVFDKSKAKTFKKSDFISPIIEKVLAKRISLPIFDVDQKDGWRLRFPRVNAGRSNGSGDRKSAWHGLGFLGPYYNGMRDGKPWYEFYQKNQYTKFTDTITRSVKFNTESEAIICSDSLKTTFGLYVTYNLMTDNHIEPDVIMWLEDYTKPWPNKRLCEHFDITGFISDTEAEPGSEWEEILNFMSKINVGVK